MNKNLNDNFTGKQPMRQRDKIALGVVIGLLCVVGYAVSGNEDNTTSGTDNTYNAAPEQATPVNPESKIEDGALDDLTDKSQFPRLNRNLGKKGVIEAMEGAKAAAYMAASSPDCDKVYAAAPVDTPQEPFTRTQKHFFANCTNGQQWRFTAAELKDEHGKWITAATAKAPGISDTDKEAEKRAAALAVGKWTDCKDALAARLPDPDSMDAHYMTEMIQDVDSKGHHTVSLGFHYQNQYGARVKARGFCTFSLDGQKITTEIYQN